MKRIPTVLFMCILGACSGKEHEAEKVKSDKMQVSSKVATSGNQPALSEPGMTEGKESDAIANSGGIVERKEQLLLLHLSSGKMKELRDEGDCKSYENCKRYVYRGLVADKQFFLITVGLYEGGGTLLYSRKTGEEVDVFSTPHVSPDGRFVVSASEAEAYGDAGVFLWEVRDGALVTRFSYVPSEYQLFRFVRWTDSAKVEMIKTTWPPKDLCATRTLAEYQMELIAKGDEWVLEAKPQAGKCL
ncbi:MAG: hypothetical protein KKH12_05180 [Gammaproteobacteria bacterium]|nr:hypothetical protein [Gammaproteobacteria bacterium]MBU1481052.1 hypothetical protein [Gammaproteobacteria bacterium]